MSFYKDKILNTLSRLLPDHRPITSLQIIEYIDKCPEGFYPINRTYDQDQDADLWRDASFLKKKCLRYLCLSKTQGLPDFVVHDIIVLTEKGLPPEGFSILNRTADSEQKAWRKKQLCYRLANKRFVKEAVTDVIICSRLKKAPEGFKLAGEINGVIICFKMGNVQEGESHSQNVPERPPRPNPTPGLVYPQLQEGGDHDYEILNPPGYVPSRPAPQPPIAHTTHTLSSNFNGLEGVPFVLNPKFITSNGAEKFQFPMIKAKTIQQVMQEYEYTFVLERQT